MDNEQSNRDFYELVWPQASVVLRTAQILCGGNETEAEDLAQETMLKAFRALDKFQRGTNVRAWLLSILRNTRIDRLRAAAKTSALSLDQLEVELAGRPRMDEPDRQIVGENPDAVLASFSDGQVIEALAKLPEEIRWTLLLVDVAAVGHEQAAELLEVPVGTIKSRAHRGRMILRESLLPVARRARILGDAAADQQDFGERLSHGSEIGKLGESNGHA